MRMKFEAIFKNGCKRIVEFDFDNREVKVYENESHQDTRSFESISIEKVFKLLQLHREDFKEGFIEGKIIKVTVTSLEDFKDIIQFAVNTAKKILKKYKGSSPFAETKIEVHGDTVTVLCPICKKEMTFNVRNEKDSLAMLISLDNHMFYCLLENEGITSPLIRHKLANQWAREVVFQIKLS